MNRRIDPSDFLLGELTDSERAEAERMLREEADFREQVERLQPIVSELRDLPPEAWRLSEQDEERVVRSTPRPAPRRRMRLALASAAACAALVGAGVGIGALIFSGGEKASTSASTVVLRPVTPRASTASGTARLDEANSEATLQVRGLPPSAQTSYYELWLMDSPNHLVSLGSFRVPASGSATVRVPLPVDPRLFHFVDISLEPVNGGPQHSGVSVLRAST